MTSTADARTEHYKVVFENDQVRVLEYTDAPGDKTTAHEHPNSVMYPLSSFRRRLHNGDTYRDVEISAGTTGWLAAQQHHGHNIGDTPTHVIFVELKTDHVVAPTDVSLDRLEPIEYHLNHAFRKLGVHSRVELVRRL